MHAQISMVNPSNSFDALSIDWQISMASARRIVGSEMVLAGNVDPMVLYGQEKSIAKAVADCINGAGKQKHVLNLGHGVEKDMSEEAVRTLVQAAKSFKI